MKKSLWKIAMLLLVLALAGCKTVEQSNTSDPAIKEQPEGQPMPVPTSTPTPEQKSTPTPTPEQKSTPTQASEQKGTLTPTQAQVSTYNVVKDCTGILVSLPDDTEKKWKSEWIESETNERIVYHSDVLPKKGKVSVKLCFPNTVNAVEREDTFELFVDENNIVFKCQDAIAQGKLGSEWTYYEFECDYITEKSELTIIVKTHSKKGSAGILFGVADVTVTDTTTGEAYKLDVTGNEIRTECKKEILNGYKDLSYELFRMTGGNIQKLLPTPTVTPTPTEEPKPSNKPVMGEVDYERNNQLYSLTYKLPETSRKWDEPWYDSEANIVFYYVSEKPLSHGTIYATLCVPKGLAKNREDAFELAVHGVEDFYNYRSDGTTVIYTDGQLFTDNRQVYEEEDCYKIDFKVDYDNSLVGAGTELWFIFKSHCTEVSGAYEVTLCNVVVEDKITGMVALDLSAGYMFLEGKMYRSGEAVEFTLSNSIFNFYIMNVISKMGTGESHVLEIYNSDDAALEFMSSDSKVASIDDEGKITAHQTGTCEITVTKKTTGESKSFTLTVAEPQVVMSDYETLLLSGTGTRLEAITEYAKKAGIYTFTSSDATIASVDNDGEVMAIKDGIVTITVTDSVNNATTSFELEVFTPEDKDGVGQYISVRETGYVTADIAKRSYQLIYDVYKNVFDYFNYGEYQNVTLVFTVNDYSPAYSDCVDVYLASEHMLANAKDVDCITHELIHCAQDYISVRENDVWLMEGLTDYGRDLFGLHNEDCGWRLPDYDPSQHYTDSYGTTAAFIKFVTDNYCADMPQIINRMFKGPDGYDESIWKTNTGYTIDELWDLYSKK